MPMLRVVSALALVCACASSSATVVRPSASPTSAAELPGAWERLSRALPGTWTATTGSGKELRVVYKLISNGSALVEAWGAGSDRETQTVFHPDHAGIMLTHYCAQGNQPRLVATAADATTYSFAWRDVTNKQPDQAMMIARRLVLDGDASHLDETETYRGSDGRDEVTTYHFVRAP